jgi:hypothetical protein
MKYLVSTSDILISQENSLVSSRLYDPDAKPVTPPPQRKRIGASLGKKR